MLRIAKGIVLTGSLMVACAGAHAQTILFTETFTGSGTLDGISFTNSSVQYAGIATIGSVVNAGGGLYTAAIPANFFTVTAGGITDTVLDSMTVFVNQPSIAGTLDNTISSYIGTVNPGFNTYGLITPINLSGSSAFGGSGGNVTTSMGQLVFTGVGSGSQFQAQIVQVPEPGVSAVLAGMGLAGLSLLRRKVRKTPTE